MDFTTYRVRPLVRGWKVEAEGSAAIAARQLGVRESKADAMHAAHSLARGTVHRIVVLDEQGKIESTFPPPNQDVEGA